MFKKIILFSIFSSLTYNSYSFICDSTWSKEDLKTINTNNLVKLNTLEIKHELLKYAFIKNLTLNNWIEYLIETSNKYNNAKIDQAISELIPFGKKDTYVINKDMWYIQEEILYKQEDSKKNLFFSNLYDETFTEAQSYIFEENMKEINYIYWLIISDKREALEYTFNILKLNTNKKISYKEENDQYDIPIIFIAAKQNNIDLVKFFLEKGADPYITFKGNNLLHLATEEDFLDLVKFLVKFETLITEKNRFDQTPLDIAIENGNFEIVEFLTNYQKLENKNDLVYSAIGNLLYNALNHNITIEKLWDDYLKNKFAVNITNSAHENLIYYLNNKIIQNINKYTNIHDQTILFNSYTYKFIKEGLKTEYTNGEIIVDLDKLMYESNLTFYLYKSWFDTCQILKEQNIKEELKNFQGKLIVEFSINKNGSLNKAAIKESCGNIDLDNLVLLSIKKIEDFPPFPESFKDQTYKTGRNMSITTN